MISARHLIPHSFTLARLLLFPEFLHVWHRQLMLPALGILLLIIFSDSPFKHSRVAIPQRNPQKRIPRLDKEPNCGHDGCRMRIEHFEEHTALARWHE